MGKMTMMRELLVLCFLNGCATTTGPAQTFTQSLATAEAAADAVVTTTTSLLQGGMITSAQAKKIATITDGINATLTLANNTYQAGNLTSANTQIQTAVKLLDSIQACLNTAAAKQPIDSCLAPLGSK